MDSIKKDLVNLNIRQESSRQRTSLFTMSAACLSPDITSKRPFIPGPGPITGLIVELQRVKNELRGITLETVRGTFTMSLNRSLREALSAELNAGMAVRCWLIIKGNKVKAQLVVPLKARPIVYTQPGSCSIWVCSSKSCCRKGGDQLFKCLLQATENNSLVKVRQCACLGACKKGPSLKISGEKRIHQVLPKNASDWLSTKLTSN